MSKRSSSAVLRDLSAARTIIDRAKALRLMDWRFLALLPLAALGACFAWALLVLLILSATIRHVCDKAIDWLMERWVESLTVARLLLFGMRDAERARWLPKRERPRE